MLNQLKKTQMTRHKRVLRVRKGVRGSAEKPRLTVFKSNKHLFAQLIDDEQGITLASLGTMSKDLAKTSENRKSKDAAKLLGKRMAEMALAKQISRVVFDRGRYKYHGLIADLADAARETGLQF